MKLLAHHPWLLFILLFAVVVAGVFSWEAYYVWPTKHWEAEAKRCEARPGYWWAEKYHSCARVVSVAKVLGRDGSIKSILAPSRAQSTYNVQNSGQTTSGPAAAQPATPKR